MQLVQADQVAVVHVTVRPAGDVEFQLRIDAVRVGAADVVGDAAGTQDRPGCAHGDRVFAGQHADADAAVGDDLAGGQVLVKLVDRARQPLVDQVAQVFHRVDVAHPVVEQRRLTADPLRQVRRDAAKAEA